MERTADTRISWRWEVGILVILTGALYLVGLGSVGFVDYDEAAYAESARQMARSGDLLVSQVEGEAFFEKPPLLYWGEIAGFRLLGVNEWGGRVPSALASMATVLLVWLFLRRCGRPEAALPSALAFALCFDAFVLARTALTDAPLTLLTTLVLVTAFGMVTRPGRPGWGACILLGASAGLAVLAKGPVGIVLPGGTLLVFLLVRGNLREGLRRLGLLRSAIVAAVVAAPWFVLMTLRFGPGFLEVFLLEHNLMRFVKSKEGHGGPPIYYLAVLLVGFFPWVVLLPGAVARAWPRRGSGKGESGRPRDLDPRKDVPLFLLVWAFVVLTFFTVSGSKLPQYIAPAYPALAVLVGLALADLRGREDASRRLRRPAIALAALALLLGAALVCAPWILDLVRDELSPDKIAASPLLQGGARPGVAVVVLGAVTILYGISILLLRRSRPERVPLAMAAGFVLILGLTVRVGSEVDEVGFRPLRSLSREAGRLVPPDEPIHVFSLRRMPSIGFYADRGYVPVLSGRKKTMRRLVARGRPFAAVAPRSDRRRFRNIEGIRIVREEGGYVLITGAD